MELKLAIPTGEVTKLQRHPLMRSLAEGRAITRHVRSVYFDTPDLDLRRHGLALRVRKVGRGWVQSVKTRGAEHGGLFERMEYDSPVPGEQPDLQRIPDLGVRALVEREIRTKALQPVVETDVRRTRRRLRMDGSELYCDLDVGEVRTPRGSDPICELELELVGGRIAALYELALELHRVIDLRPVTSSKADRGFARLTGARATPCKAHKVPLRPDATLEDALAAIFESCLEQIRANETPAYDGTDSEGVHQMRVGVRRLRSAFSLFRSVLPEEPLARLKDELRWLAGELGMARDLDVFLEETLEPIQQRFPENEALARIVAETRTMRARAYEGVRRAIDSPRYGWTLLALGGWLSARAWRDQPLSMEAARLFSPAREQSAALLQRRHRKAHKLGRGIAKRSAEEQHHLRVMLKKLRYGAEFLRGAHPSGRADKYISRLSDLQDVLGHLNDVTTAEKLLGRILDQLGDEAGAGHHHAAGFVAGWTAHLADQRLARLTKQWKTFERTRPFWSR